MNIKALPEELYVKHYAYASCSNDTVAKTPAAVTPFVTVAGSTTSDFIRHLKT